MFKQFHEEFTHLVQSQLWNEDELLHTDKFSPEYAERILKSMEIVKYDLEIKVLGKEGSSPLTNNFGLFELLLLDYYIRLAIFDAKPELYERFQSFFLSNIEEYKELH